MWSPSSRSAAAALVLVLAASQVSLAGGLGTRGPVGSSTQAFVPTFNAPQLTPREFLFISSPKERKVVYTELKNFQSSTGRVFALIDSGLIEPAGLAFDRSRAALYVADRGANSIFRYRVMQKTDAAGKKVLVTDGVQLCVMVGHKVEWVSVDPQSGDVFYSDAGKNTINKITEDVVEQLANGAYQCGEIQVVSEKARMAATAATERKLLAMDAEERQAALPTDAPNTQPVSLELYQGSINPHVTVPGGVVSDGARLFWTNTQKGKEAGSAVMGSVAPRLSLDSELGDGAVAPFPATALTNQTDVAYGIAKAGTIVFYSANVSGTGFVYGVMDDGHAHTLLNQLVEPRGMVWDGDQTVYVADQGTGIVWSFPSGRLMDDAPMTRSAMLEGAFGVALVSEGDSPQLNSMQSVAFGLPHHGLWGLAVLLLLVAGSSVL